MKKIIAVFSLCFLHAVFAFAQFTTTTATITDSDSTVWTNAQVTVSFQPNPNQPNLNSYNINGTSLLSPTYSSYLQQAGTTNGSGVLSFTLLDNQLITPAGSSWHFVIKPNASVQATSYNPIAVTGANFSLTSYLSINSVAPRFPALLNAYGYSDIEVFPIPNVGGFYFNSTSSVQRIWNGTSWQNGSGSGGTIPATNNVLKGSGAAGTAVPAVLCTDYLAPNCPVSAAGLILIPNGTTAGSPSFPMEFDSLYDTGGGVLGITKYTFHIQIGSGVNPFSQLVIDAPSGTPGGSQILNLLQWNQNANLNIQTGYKFNIADLTPSSNVCTDTLNYLTTAGCGSSGGSGVTPKTFGAKGDGLVIGNGCTTNGTTTISCPGAQFITADIGKIFCVTGAGASGGSFCSTIVTVPTSTTVTAAATPATNVTSSQTMYGTDDVVPLQNCFNASAALDVPCTLGVPINFNTPNGYLIRASGLTIPTKSNIQGSASNNGTTILSEFNGYALSMPTSTASLQAGQPIEAATLNNFSIWHDPSQPLSGGIHLNAAIGVFGFGGMFNSNITSVSDGNSALECLWLDGHTNSDDNPNQYINLTQFKCNTADQMHTAAAIKITGIQAQILFEGGSVDGPTLQSNSPNPLIYLGEKTSGQGDSPVDVKFIGFTCERSSACYSVNNGTNNIHVENSYIESVHSPLIASNTFGLTFKGNHIANSGDVGGVAQFSGNVSATLQDNFVYGSTPPVAFAVCSGGTNSFAIDFLNNDSSLASTSNCATNHSGTGAALFQAAGTTVTVDASSVVITTIRDHNVQPGKTLTLKALASGAPNSFSLGTGGTPTGNDYPINLGAYTSPLVISAGNTVTLALLDVSGAPVYTVIGVTSSGYTGTKTAGSCVLTLVNGIITNVTGC